MGGLFSKPKAPAKSETQIRAEKRAEERDARLESELSVRKAASRRKRRGRASLISNDERGVRATLG